MTMSLELERDKIREICVILVIRDSDKKMSSEFRCFELLAKIIRWKI